MCRGKKASIDEAIEELLRDNSTKAKKKLNRSINCQEAIESLGTFSIDPPSIEIAIEIAIRNNLRSRQKGQVSKRCRGCLKTIFQEGKNIDMNANKHATQPLI